MNMPDCVLFQSRYIPKHCPTYVLEWHGTSRCPEMDDGRNEDRGFWNEKGQYEGEMMREEYDWGDGVRWRMDSILGCGATMENGVRWRLKYDGEWEWTEMERSKQLGSHNNEKCEKISDGFMCF